MQIAPHHGCIYLGSQSQFSGAFKSLHSCVPSSGDATEFVVCGGCCAVEAYGYYVNIQAFHFADGILVELGSDAGGDCHVDAAALRVLDEIVEVGSHEGITSGQEKRGVWFTELDQLIDKLEPLFMA